MTTKQSKLLKYIDGYTREHGGVAPTFEEMQAHLGLGSKSGVSSLLIGLEARGMIRRLKGKMRAIEVLRLPTPAIPAPARRTVGFIAIADHIAAQPWCSADAETVLASLRDLRK